MKDCLETVIEEGVRLYCVVRADSVSDPRKARGFREKTQKQRAIDREKLQVVTEILDRLGWAMTPVDAERKLKNGRTGHVSGKESDVVILKPASFRKES